MGLFGFFILLIIAALCGSIGASIAGRNHYGCLTNIVLGFAGALIGTWLSDKMGIGDLFYFHRIPIIWSIIGAALFVALVELLTGRRK